MGSPIGLQGLLIRAKGAHQIHHCVRARDTGGNAIGLAHIAAGKLQLPQIAQRFERKGALRIARGNTQPRTARQQVLRDMAADKAAAADQNDELVFER